MSSAKRPYNETISSNSSTTLNDSNDYDNNIVEEAEQDMEIEQQEAEVESFTRRRKLNDDLGSSTFASNPFPSTLNPSSTSSPSNTASPFNVSSKNTKPLDPIDLLKSSPPISTSIQKTNQAKNTSNSSLTLTAQNLDTWDTDFNYTYSSNLRAQTNTNTNTNMSNNLSTCFHAPYSNNSNGERISDDSSDNHNTNNSSSKDDSTDNINESSSNDYNINNGSSNNDDIFNSSSSTYDFGEISSYDPFAPNNNIRTQLTKRESKGPFKQIYSQIYDNNRMVVDVESFNYLVQLFEFCDNNSTNLHSNITSTLTNLVLLLNTQLDGFDIPFIEHHKWNGSSFYGAIDVVTLLDDLDDGLGISSAEYVFYDRAYRTMVASGSVLQCGYRRTYRRIDVQSSSSTSSSTSLPSDQSKNNDNELQNNELRHAVLDEDAEREAQHFLELLAEEEEDGVEDNGTEQSDQEDPTSNSEQDEESDSFTEISKESDDDDDNDSIIHGCIRQTITHTDTFGNPTNPARTTSTRRISRPSGDGNETEDDYLIDSDNSAFEEIDMSDIESIATDSTIEDGWHNVSRNEN